MERRVVVDHPDQRGARGEEAPLESHCLTVTQALELLRGGEHAPAPLGVRRRIGQCQRLEALLGLRGNDQLLDRIAARRVEGPGGLELPGEEQAVEGAEDPAGVVRLAAQTCEDPQRAVEQLDRGQAYARVVTKCTLR